MVLETVLLLYIPLQTRLEMQKALEENSTVYEYDSVYDDIQKERLESNKKLLGGADKKVYFKILLQIKSFVYSMDILKTKSQQEWQLY